MFLEKKSNSKSSMFSVCKKNMFNGSAKISTYRARYYLFTLVPVSIILNDLLVVFRTHGPHFLTS